MSDLRSITKFFDAQALTTDIPDDADILVGIGNQVFRVTKAELEDQIGGGDFERATWTTISGKPAVVAEGATQAAARSSIGAGTGDSNLALGATASTAAAGNHTHSEYAATGHTHSEYAATGHTHSEYATTQALADLAARVEALEGE